MQISVVNLLLQEVGEVAIKGAITLTLKGLRYIMSGKSGTVRMAPRISGVFQFEEDADEREVHPKRH